MRNGEAAIRDYLTTLAEDPAVVAEIGAGHGLALLSRSRRGRRAGRRDAGCLVRPAASRSATAPAPPATPPRRASRNLPSAIDDAPADDVRNLIGTRA